MLTPPRNEINCFYRHDWNYAYGCKHVSRGCKNCALQGLAGVYPQFAAKGVTTGTKDGRHVWNGKVWIAPTDDPVWLDPLLPAGSAPSLDPGKPSLVIVNVASDPFHEDIPAPVIKLAFQTIASSRHTGMFLTRRCERAAAILAAAAPNEQRLWKQKSLIGFSAEGQAEFDQRWAAMKPLAEAGWPVCASLAPLLEPVKLPPDYLSLACWVIVYGEQGPHAYCRDMDPDWVRAIVKQCHGATPRIPVYVRQMARRETIPLDLLLHEFPSFPISRSQNPTHHSLPTAPSGVGLVQGCQANRHEMDAHRIINLRQTSAAGKTTIVRQLIERTGSEPLYGMFGQKQPEAHRLLCEQPLFALGPYPAAGCDAVLSRFGIAGVIALLDKYAARGDVIFEALIISSMFGKVGEWLEARKSSAIIAVLDVTLADCLAGLAERQGDNPKAAKTLEGHYRRTLKVAERMRDQGLRVEMLRRDAAVDTLLGWLTKVPRRD